MKRTWMIVADRVSAKVYEIEGRGLALQQELDHPEGRLHDGDYDSDRPGRSFDSHGDHRHAMERSEMPSEREANKWAKRIAEVMKRGRTSDAVGRFVLVAEPGFLGVLRGALGSHEASLVDGTIGKELTGASDAQLAEALSKLFPTLA